MPDYLSTLRAVLGASFGAERKIPATPPPPDRPARLDVEVTLVGVNEDLWTATIDVPAYDLATYNLLAEVRAYVIPDGHGLPADAAGYLASSYPFESVNLASVLDGARVALPLPEVDPGRFFGRLILLFDDNATEPAPVPPDDDEPGEPEPPTTG